MYAGSAATGAGVPDLLGGLAALLPTAPDEGDGTPCGQVFKVERGRAGDKVAYVRMFAGCLVPRQGVALSGGSAGKAASLERLVEGRWSRTDLLGAGEIGRVHGWSAVRVGDRFGEPLADEHHFPPPTLEAEVRPVDPARGAALRTALALLSDQDPLIGARSDDDGRMRVSLYGRVQQEVLGSTLLDDHGIEVEFADASVLHVERPRGRGEAVLRLNTDENPHQATIGLRIEPAPPGSGLQLVVDVSANDMPLYLFKSVESFASAIRRFVTAELRRGRLGWEVTDAVVTLTECAYSVADGPPSRRGPTSTSSDYRKVTPVVARRALDRARTVVCEPVLRVHLEVPTRDAPALQRVVTRWGAELLTQTVVDDLTRLDVRLAAARLHELQRQLPDLTGGEGVLEAQFDGYEPVRGRPPARRTQPSGEWSRD